MAAEVIVEVYRFKEDRSTFKFSAAVTITYFNGVAYLHGLHGAISLQDIRELWGYLVKRGTTKAVYNRRGVLKELNLT